MDPSSQSEPPSGDPPTHPPSTAGGRTFHHYEVCLREDGTTLHELGRGAMGITYKARDTNLDVPVAIKVIHADLPSQINARGRFRREARAAAQLRHANVASVFHFGELPTGDCFYAMEFIDGETLADRVRREGPLTAADALEVALQITAALIAAAERGLVHRDLKPANVMLARRDPPTGFGTGGFHRQRLLVKVIDFGLAKAASPAQSAHDHEEPLTQMGDFLGTPAYASPEQAEGGEVDARSDMYSLGVILWYLLTGKVPFTGRSFSEIYARQLRQTLPLAQLADARVPAPLVRLLTDMLSVDPRKRPASPAALYDELERCRDASVGRSPPSALPRGSAKSRPRRKVLAMSAAIVAALGLAGLGAFVLTTRRAGSVPVPPPAAPAPSKSIAVLPLENLSGDPADMYFADGIQDDLLSSLSRVRDLKVISRSSVMGYRDIATRNLRDISQQLGVTTVLEGSVRRAPDRVLVNVALIDAHTGLQLWAERYDRTLADALSLQGEVATEIAAALSVALGPEEKTRVEAKPTDNADAYVLYLRARDYQTRPFTLLQDLQTAEHLYREALALDPNFALAHARLAATLAFHHLTFEPTAEIHDQARAEAEEALRLRPDSGEGHLARALCLYWTEKNYEGALRELDIAARLLPGSAETDLISGAIRRRQGYWTQAVTNMRRALAGDPRNAQIAREILYTVCMMRDWPAAARDAERAVALAPNNPMIQVEKGHVDYWASRNLAPLRAVLAAACRRIVQSITHRRARSRLPASLGERDDMSSGRDRSVTICGM